MRRLGLISAALLLLLTLPAFGQRGGHGGGFGSFGGGFHGGSAGGSGSYAGVPAFGAVGVRPSGVPAFGAVGVRPHFNGNMRSPDFNQGAFHRGAGHPWPYRPYRGRGFAPGYGYGYGAYLWPNFVGYPFGFGDFDDDDMDDASAVQQGAYPGPSSEEAPPAEDYDQPPPAGVPYAGADANVPYAGAYSEVPYAGAYSEEPPPPAGAAIDEYRPPYQGSSQAPSRSEQQPIRPQPATTIVFSNGWPSMKVHNYVVTKTTFYDLDGGKQREIPLGEIDVPATKKANRSAGVNFAPPVT